MNAHLLADTPQLVLLPCHPHTHPILPHGQMEHFLLATKQQLQYVTSSSLRLEGQIFSSNYYTLIPLPCFEAV